MSLLLLAKRAGGGAAAGGTYTANVSALAVASRQQPDWAWYVANVRGAAGNTLFTDPVLGQKMLKLTSASYPVANIQAKHDYSNGGPQFSLGFGTNSADTTTLIRTENTYRMVDLLYNGGTPTASNWRTPPYALVSDLMYGFSRTTQHIMYITDGAYLRKINTQTNTEVTGGVWPKNLSAYIGSAPGFDWVQVALDDSCIAMQRTDKTLWLVYYPGSDTVRQWTKAQLDANIDLTRFGADGFDEVHLSDYGTFGEVIAGANYERKFIDIASRRETAQTGDYAFTHTAAMSDSVYIGTGPDSGLLPQRKWTVAPITVDGQAATVPTDITSGVSGFDALHSSAYFRRTGTLDDQYMCGAAARFNATVINAASWSVHSGSIYVSSTFSTTLAGIGYQAVARGVNDIWERASDSSTASVSRTLTKAASVGAMTAGSFYWDSGAGALYLWATNGSAPGLRHILAGRAVNNEAIALCKMDGADIRMVQFCYSLNSDYYAATRAHISPNGVWVMSGTDHGVSGGRNDVMVHINPVVGA